MTFSLSFPRWYWGAPLINTSISASYSSFLFRALLPHSPPLTSDLAVSILLLWAFSKSGFYFFPQHDLSRLRNMLPSPPLNKKSSLKSAFFLRSSCSFLLSFNPTVQPHSSNFVLGSFFLFRSLNSTNNDRNTFFCNKSGHYRQSPSSWGITPSSHTVHSFALFLIPCLFSDYCQSFSIHVYLWEMYYLASICLFNINYIFTYQSELACSLNCKPWNSFQVHSSSIFDCCIVFQSVSSI